MTDLQGEAPEFIAEVMALGSTNVERAQAIGAHVNTISTMKTSGRIPKCLSRYLPYPNVIAALHRDALALQAKKKNGTAT